jgi:tol-pal system protein YbgF
MKLRAGLLAALLAVGCVTVPEFRALQRDVADLRAGRSSGAPAREDRVAELGSQVEELQAEVGRLRGEIEELRHAKPAPTGAAAARPADDVAVAPEGGAAAGPEGSAELRQYEEAFGRFRENDYKGAIDRFRAFLQNHPSSDYADNALFWLGESYFRVGDYEQAVLTFEDVAKKYPGGNKVPDALYRQGLALLELGRRDGQADTYGPAARQVFQRIVDEYPQSERVAEARQQLEKLRR